MEKPRSQWNEKKVIAFHKSGQNDANKTWHWGSSCLDTGRKTAVPGRQSRASKKSWEEVTAHLMRKITPKGKTNNTRGLRLNEWKFPRSVEISAPQETRYYYEGDEEEDSQEIAVIKASRPPHNRWQEEPTDRHVVPNFYTTTPGRDSSTASMQDDKY